MWLLGTILTFFYVWRQHKYYYSSVIKNHPFNKYTAKKWSFTWLLISVILYHDWRFIFIIHLTEINPPITLHSQSSVGQFVIWEQSITEIGRSLTRPLWAKTHARKGEALDPLNNLIPNIIPNFNLVKFMFTQIKPHRNQSCLNQRYPTGEGECVYKYLKCNLFCVAALDVLHTDVSALVSQSINKSSHT